MNTSRFPLFVLLAGMSLLLSACVFLEETGSGQRVENPQKSPAKVDTLQRSARLAAARKAASDSVKPKKSVRVAPNFKSKQDTVHAALTRKSKTASRPKKIERPDNPMYTVQLGAFGKAPNALHNQKLAKERFDKYPVFNSYAQNDKLYRVSVGKFEDQKSAEKFRSAIIKEFPKDYAACWVNYIAK